MARRLTEQSGEVGLMRQRAQSLVIGSGKGSGAGGAHAAAAGGGSVRHEGSTRRTEAAARRRAEAAHGRSTEPRTCTHHRLDAVSISGAAWGVARAAHAPSGCAATGCPWPRRHIAGGGEELQLSRRRCQTPGGRTPKRHTETERERERARETNMKLLQGAGCVPVPLPNSEVPPRENAMVVARSAWPIARAVERLQ